MVDRKGPHLEEITPILGPVGYGCLLVCFGFALSYRPLVGYDKIMEQQILRMLKANDYFRVQVVDLITGKRIRIEIEEDVSYNS